MFHVKQREFDI